MNEPIVSVLMPVYNCEKYISEAVQSIFNQTFIDFELIVIDDCSTDSTVEIIKKFSDKRIKLIQKPINTGYTNSLNMAILEAKGKYIARMDGDDIALPERFTKQVSFLEKNPDIILCGTSVRLLGEKAIWMHPSCNDEIKVKLCFSTAFNHPTVMIKKEVLLVHNYNKDFEPAEDYELWTRLVFVGKVANLNEVLLDYRIHSNQISNSKRKQQEDNIERCRFLMLERLGIDKYFTSEQITNAFNFSSYRSYDNVEITLRIFDFILKSNSELLVFNQNYLKKDLENKKIFLFRNFMKEVGYRYIDKVFFLLKFISIKEFLIVLNFKKIIRKLTKKQ